MLFDDEARTVYFQYQLPASRSHLPAQPCLPTTPSVSHLTPTLSLNTDRTSSKRNKERLWLSSAAERSGTWRLERRPVTLSGWYSREEDRTSEFCLSKSIAIKSVLRARGLINMVFFHAALSLQLP